MSNYIGSYILSTSQTKFPYLGQDKIFDGKELNISTIKIETNAGVLIGMLLANVEVLYTGKQPLSFSMGRKNRSLLENVIIRSNGNLDIFDIASKNIHLYAQNYLQLYYPIKIIDSQITADKIRLESNNKVYFSNVDVSCNIFTIDVDALGTRKINKLESFFRTNLEFDTSLKKI